MDPHRNLDLSAFIKKNKFVEPLASISSKILKGGRITISETVQLYENADLGLLSMLANYVRDIKNGNHVYFNKNFHIEPTNTCIYNCKFCSYHKAASDPESWEMTLNEIAKLAESYEGKSITEVHVVGGVHPKWDIGYYGKIIKSIKKVLPNVHVKAFSAIELEYVIKKANLSHREGMKKLKGYGLDSIPGGGAEIFDPEVREKICSDKATGRQWLEVHEAAHLEGVPSNATMLYGHIESYKHRAEHMYAIRNLQDRTGGFNCFIPLKFRAQHNKLGYLGEVETVEDLRNFAVSRIFFDNINHIKAYWPMLGKQNTKLAISFGVDDIDGTIDDTTKIYSMAGAEDQKPSMTVEMLTDIIKNSGKTPVERDSLYNIIKYY
ncbi:MAG: CofH family radical SAM protein [Bacteroidales bacterium]|nr:CofH family radical SAM protein [Bacteroidales bacterium]